MRVLGLGRTCETEWIEKGRKSQRGEEGAREKLNRSSLVVHGDAGHGSAILNDSEEDLEDGGTTARQSVASQREFRDFAQRSLCRAHLWLKARQTPGRWQERQYQTSVLVRERKSGSELTESGSELRLILDQEGNDNLEGHVLLRANRCQQNSIISA